MDYFTNKFSTQIVDTPIESLDVDAVVIGVYENLTSPSNSAFARLKESIGSLVDFNGKEKDVFIAYNVKGVRYRFDRLNLLLIFKSPKSCISRTWI